MKKERKVWAMTCIALWWLAPNQTNAQQDSTSSRILSEVVVTATKFPKTLGETGKVLTIIDREQLQEHGGKDLSQILNEQVGLVINGANSNLGKDKAVYMRGAKSEYTLVLLDGVPLNDPSAIGGGAYDLRLLSLDQIERIEILKGSQSTLYGSDAIAGVINIISRKGGGKPKGEISAQYGSFQTLRGSAMVTGGGSKVNYNAGLTQLSSRGISEASNPNHGDNYEKDGFLQRSFHGSVGITPVANWSVRPNFRYTLNKGDYDGGTFTDNAQNTYTYELLSTGLTSQYTLQKGAVNATYGYNDTKRRFDDTYGKSAYNGRFHQGELFLNYQLHPNLQVLSGSSFQSWRMSDTTATPKNPSIQMTSPYVALFLKHPSGWSAEIGGRANFHSQYGNNLTYGFNPSYRLHDRLKVFANITTGFKAPTLNQLYGQYGANPDLKPERSQSQEVGLQYFFKNKKMDARLVGYHRRIDDVIFYTSSGYFNQDQQNDRGIELETFYMVSKKIKLNFFYGYVDGYVISPDTSNEKVHNLFRRPKHSGGLSVSANVTPQLIITLRASTFGKRSDLYFDNVDFSTKTVELKAYQLIDLYGAYSFASTLRVFVEVRNLLNQNYFEVYGYSTLPLNATAGFRYRIE